MQGDITLYFYLIQVFFLYIYIYIYITDYHKKLLYKLCILLNVSIMILPVYVPQNVILALVKC